MVLGHDEENPNEFMVSGGSESLFIDIYLYIYMVAPLHIYIYIISFIRERSDPYQKIGFAEGRKPYKNRGVMR